MTEIDYLALVNSCFCTNTRILARKITRVYDNFLAPSGININQLSILLTIQGLNQGVDNASATLVSEYLSMDPSSVSRSLRNLEKMGIITMVYSDKNRRKKFIELTEYGGSVLMKAFPYWQQAQEEIRKQIGNTAFGNMIDLLTHISPSLDNVGTSEGTSEVD